jgi:hypothetical protein
MGLGAESEREYAAALRISQPWARLAGWSAQHIRTRTDHAARMWLAAQAVQHAEQADSSSGKGQLEALEDLVVAYAAAERFEEASAAADQAVRAAEIDGEPELAARFRELRNTYRK